MAKIYEGRGEAGAVAMDGDVDANCGVCGFFRMGV